MNLQGKTAHFTGIGGVGMSGLAELCHRSGLKISGSDLQEGPAVRRLVSLGIPVFIGHKASCITKDTGRLIFSSAIDPLNIELQEARKRGIPIVSRSEALAEMMRLKRGIVVSGTHGKTTVTALLGSAFQACGADPTVMAGGRPAAFESTARLGKGEWFIAESDESDGSFHHLRPEIAVLTNIDDDHADFYGSFAKLKQSFAGFLGKIPEGGVLIACGDCPHVLEAVRSLSPRRKIKICFYGLKESNDFVLKRDGGPGGDGGLRIFSKNQLIAVLKPPLMGEHNSLNVAAAFLCGREAGLSPKRLIQSLNSFQGVTRRGELRAVIEGIHFFDDYAHHPTEIQAVLRGFREKFPRKRLIALFQPHRYSRLRRCWKGFLGAFRQADSVYVSDVYPAGEKPIPGVSGPDFALALQKQTAPPSGDFSAARIARDSGPEAPLVADRISADRISADRISADRLAADRKDSPANQTERNGIPQPADSKHPQVFFTPAGEAPLKIVPALRSGDLFVTLGAGSVYQTGEEIIRQIRLRQNSCLQTPLREWQKNPLPEKNPLPDKTPSPKKNPLPDKTPSPEKNPLPDKTPSPKKNPLPENPPRRKTSPPKQNPRRKTLLAEKPPSAGKTFLAEKNSLPKKPPRRTNPPRRASGAALMTVLALTAAVGVILQKVWRDSRLEYLSSRGALHDLRAKYNVQSGMELSLLRLSVFKAAKQVLRGNKRAAFFKPYLDLIWREPLVWPLPVPAEISEADRQTFGKIQADSFLKGGYVTEILPEDGKINLNLFADPAEHLKAWTELSFFRLLENEANRLSIDWETADIGSVMNNVSDWTDRDNERRGGGLEESSGAQGGPLNRSFLFLEELRSVPGVTTEIYNLIAPFASVSAAAGWNVNYAPRELLEASGLSEDAAAAVLARTTPSSPHYSPFSDKEGFCDFLTEQGFDFCSFLQEDFGTDAMLKFDAPSNFLIRGRGFFRNSESRSEALVYDATLSLADYRKAVEEQEKINRGEETEDTKPPLAAAGAATAADQAREERERQKLAEKKAKRKKIKYRSFSPLHIIYWREI